MNITIEWVAMRKIRARHRYIPHPSTVKKNFQLFSINNPHVEVYKKPNGEFLLKKGLKAYNAFKEIIPDDPIPVFITEKNITEVDWAIELLHSCFTERVSSRLTQEYVRLSVGETNNDIKRICKGTGRTKEDIEKYLIDPRVPNRYQELAIKHGRHKLVNQIVQDQDLEEYRYALYEAVFASGRGRLTQQKLAIFIRFLQQGYKVRLCSDGVLTPTEP
jgi:hypothetical protein